MSNLYRGWPENFINVYETPTGGRHQDVIGNNSRENAELCAKLNRAHGLKLLYRLRLRYKPVIDYDFVQLAGRFKRHKIA